MRGNFRLYDKLAGMTGTAMTEEVEFREIYKLDVVEIPTNKPMQRIDKPDNIFKTEKGKFEAVIEDIIKCHEKGQPVLVGTISIEKSEILSSMLKKKGIKHEVLNAKYHEKEAEIVAQAGKKGAVTIATNMAGRGTDIVLGGNAEYMAKAEMRNMKFTEEQIVESTSFSETDDEEILKARKKYKELFEKHKKEIEKEAEAVKEAGGLFIMGTERHESRRIDNQLRGRSGRQGDPGMSCFYLSAEDDLMRLFGGERIQTFLEKYNVEENVPIESKMLSRAIENAQKKVEGRNFGIRKNVLQFDDVMNRQRELIYDQRNKVLDGEDLKVQITSMIEQAIKETVSKYISEDTLKEDWNIEGLRDYYLGWILNEDDIKYSIDDLENVQVDDIIKIITDKAKDLYENREKEFGTDIMRELERVVLLKNVDTQWMDHIDAMEELKRGIRLRAYAQRDPVVEYRLEGFDMFDEMIASIRTDTARMILTVRIKHQNEAPKREQVANPAAAGSSGTGDENRTVRKGKKIGRNDPCPCGSGKKYKKCCGRDE